MEVREISVHKFTFSIPERRVRVYAGYMGLMHVESNTVTWGIPCKKQLRDRGFSFDGLQVFPYPYIVHQA